MSGNGTGEVGIEPHASRAQALRAATAALAGGDGRVGGDSRAEARREARLLLLHALGLTVTDLALRPHEPVGAAEAAALDAAIVRRRAGEPVARILGAWEFWGLPFALAPETLVPRSDTETLVEAGLALLPERSRAWRVLDLGTGSGCVLVALLAERPRASGLGTDRSLGALACARANAAANGVGARAGFVQGDWCAALRGPFDLIVSNPPYIASGAIAGLAVEVARHDPRAALDGGADGLSAYRAILDAVAGRPGLIAPGGALALEVGFDQAGDVARLAAAAGLDRAEVARDLGGRERVVTLRPPFPGNERDKKR